MKPPIPYILEANKAWYRLSKSWLVLISLCMAVGCASAQRAEDIIGITVLYRSPTCDAFCRIQFTANKDKKAIIKTPGIDMKNPTDRTLQRKTLELDTHEWQKLLDSFSLEEIKEMPKVMGCPGCNDNPAGTLFLATVDSTIQIDFEALDPPEGLRELTLLLTDNYLAENEY